MFNSNKPKLILEPANVEQFSALAKFLKGSKIAFKVPQDDDDVSFHYFHYNPDDLDFAVNTTIDYGLLSHRDAKALFPDVVLETSSGPEELFFQIPKQDTDFWGAEFLTSKNQLTLANAIQRLRLYCFGRQTQADTEPFPLDETLQRILKTTQTSVSLKELPDILTRAFH